MVLPVPTARLFLSHQMRVSQQTRAMGKGHTGDLDGASWMDGDPSDAQSGCKEPERPKLNTDEGIHLFETGQLCEIRLKR